MMYLSKISIPRIDLKALVKLEKSFPGLTSFKGVGVIDTADEAVRVAKDQVTDAIDHDEVIGGWSVEETKTGWDIEFRIIYTPIRH